MIDFNTIAETKRFIEQDRYQREMKHKANYGVYSKRF